MLVSHNKSWIEMARIIRSHGMTGRDDHVCLGYNYRMNEMAAAMGLVQLKKLEGFNQRRISNSLFLLRELGKDKPDWFSVPNLQDHIRHTFFWCPLIIHPNKDVSTQDVVLKLKQKGIEVRQRYKAPLYKQDLFQAADNGQAESLSAWKVGRTLPDYISLHLPNAERLAGNVIGLPNHSALGHEDLDYIVQTVRNLY